MQRGPCWWQIDVPSGDASLHSGAFPNFACPTTVHCVQMPNHSMPCVATSLHLNWFFLTNPKPFICLLKDSCSTQSLTLHVRKDSVTELTSQPSIALFREHANTPRCKLEKKVKDWSLKCILSQTHILITLKSVCTKCLTLSCSCGLTDNHYNLTAEKLWYISIHWCRGGLNKALLHVMYEKWFRNKMVG